MLLRTTRLHGHLLLPEALMEDGESLSGFFSVLRQGESGHRQRFNVWLDNVAQAISNVRALLAGDIIIGGEAAQYLSDEDMADLRERVEGKSPFKDDFIMRKSLCAEDQNIIGAALRFVQSYVNEICNVDA